MKMKDFQHPNILTLIGVAKDNNSNPCIVMPFMWSGSLDVYLRKEENRAVLLLEDATTDCSQVVSLSFILCRHFFFFEEMIVQSLSQAQYLTFM